MPHNHENCKCGEPLADTGEILCDVRKNKKGQDKEQPWAHYKKLVKVLDAIFDRAMTINPDCISESAKFALSHCATWLLFRRYHADGSLKLEKADLCRGRFCPVCNWRKSLKMYAQMQKVSTALLKTFPTARFLFLTLTVKNCSGADLAQTLDDMNAGLNLMFSRNRTNASAKPIFQPQLGELKCLLRTTPQATPKTN
jgi:plasmid rolling circle replication initiator protein Rep